MTETVLHHCHYYPSSLLIPSHPQNITARWPICLLTEKYVWERTTCPETPERSRDSAMDEGRISDLTITAARHTLLCLYLTLYLTTQSAFALIIGSNKWYVANLAPRSLLPSCEYNGMIRYGSYKYRRPETIRCCLHHSARTASLLCYYKISEEIWRP